MSVLTFLVTSDIPGNMTPGCSASCGTGSIGTLPEQFSAGS